MATATEIKGKVKRGPGAPKGSKRGPMSAEQRKLIGIGVARRAAEKRAANLGLVSAVPSGSLEETMKEALKQIDSLPWSYQAEKIEIELAGKLEEMLNKFKAHFGGNK